MAVIPSGQKFHTISASVDTKEKGSAQANALKDVYTATDIIDTVSDDLVEGGTTNRLVKFDANDKLEDSSITDSGSSVVTTSTFTADSLAVDRMGVAPSSATATGQEGQLVFTADHIYVCVDRDTWKRVAIATF